METGEAVLVADPDEASGAALAAVLRNAGFTVVQTTSGDEALALARSRRPAALILEIPLEGLSGYEVCHVLKSDPGSDVPVLFLSAVRTEPYDRAAGLLLGADDYMVKPYAPGELLARLVNVVRRSRARAPGAGALTKRELEVLALMGDGLRQDDIARRLFISPKTVSTHVEHVLRKLGAHNSTEAVAIAYREEILRPRPPLSARPPE